MPSPQEEGKEYTYADYLTWPEDDPIKVSIFTDLVVDLRPVFEGI